MSFHRKLRELLKKLGYNEQVSTDISFGVCHGFSVTWMLAQIICESEIFDSRLLEIKTLDLDTLCTQLNSVQTEKEIIRRNEFFAFFDLLLLIQSPYDTGLYLGEQYPSLSQENIVGISDLYGSQVLEELGGLNRLFFTPFAGNKDSYMSFFGSIREGLTGISYPHTTPIGITISDASHTIALSYNIGSDQFLFININDNNGEKRIITTQALVNEIFISLKGAKNQHLVTSISFFCAHKKNTPILTALFDDIDFKDLVKRYDMHKKTSGKTSILAEAIFYSAPLPDILFLIELFIEHQILSEKDLKFSWLFAANSGSLECIRLLHTHFPLAVEVTNDDGYNALMISASLGKYDVVEFLAKNTNLYLKDPSGRTIFEYAILRHDVKLIEILLKYQVRDPYYKLTIENTENLLSLVQTINNKKNLDKLSVFLQQNSNTITIRQLNIWLGFLQPKLRFFSEMEEPEEVDIKRPKRSDSPCY